MNLQLNVLGKLCLAILLFFSYTGCDKDSDLDPNPQTEIDVSGGLSEEELESYPGDIGVVISAREVAKRGYAPVTMEVNVEASLGNYSETIELDAYSLLGQINLSLEELSEEAAEELREGVPVAVKLLDANGSLIKEELFTNRSFKTDPSTLIVSPHDLPDLNTTIDLKQNTPYYLQIVDEGGTPTGSALTLKDVPYPGKENMLIVSENNAFDGKEGKSLFHFRPLSTVENGFVIYNETVNRVLEHLPLPHNRRFVSANTNKNRFFDWSESQVLNYPSLYFTIEKEKDGVYVMKSATHSGALLHSGVLGLSSSSQWSSTTRSIVRFRPIAMDVLWSFETIGTEYMRPMLPKANTSFGFNNTLINCGSGPLVQDVGASISETITVTTGWEESVSVTTVHANEATVGIGFEVSGSFFGNQASYSADFSYSVSTSRSATESNSNWGATDKVTQESYFVNREVTVPPKKASLVVDALQKYENVKVHFVQRLRVRARDADTSIGNPVLSGKQIQSLFTFSGFNGVITEIGSDYVEVSVKGVTTLGQWIETKSEVRDVDPECE